MLSGPISLLNDVLGVVVTLQVGRFLLPLHAGCSLLYLQVERSPFLLVGWFASP